MMADEITRLRTQLQTLTQDVSHWKHEAEQWKSLCRERLGPAGYKILEEVKLLRSERTPDTSALDLLKEVSLHFANGSADDGMDLWRRISDHLLATAEKAGAK